jgi:hypothetical protein
METQKGTEHKTASTKMDKNKTSGLARFGQITCAVAIFE